MNDTERRIMNREDKPGVLDALLFVAAMPLLFAAWLAEAIECARDERAMAKAAGMTLKEFRAAHPAWDRETAEEVQ